MSEKTRRKKAGHNTDKDRAAMREAVQDRRDTAITSRAGNDGEEGDHDKPDYIPYKRGSEEDRTVRNNTQAGGKR